MEVQQKIQVLMKVFTIMHCYIPNLFVSYKLWDYCFPKMSCEYSFVLLAPFVGGQWY